MTQSLKATMFSLIISFFCIISIECSDVALVSKRLNPCGKGWLPYLDEKCLMIIEGVYYDKTSGAALCRQITKVFETDYSLLRIQNEEEQAVLSKMLFVEQNIKHNIWLEFEVNEDIKEVVEEKKAESFLRTPVHYSNWAKLQSQNHGQCVQMLPKSNGIIEGQWSRVSCMAFNVVVCERPQPVTLETLQVKHSRIESMVRRLLKKESNCKECNDEICNIAKGKPVEQSSTYPGSFAAHATDGNTSTMQHTADGDRFPWWRIDLLQSYDVRKVSVFSRPSFEGRFHDVDIVVSNTDIGSIPRRTVFKPNEKSICANNIGSDYAVNPGWTTVDCKQLVVGRYVSIQITADCKSTREDCIGPRDRSDPQFFQLLQMMEVQVFGVLPKNLV